MTFYGKMLAGVLALGTMTAAAPLIAQQPPAQIKVSSKAQPALLALQNAVNANDTAKIPGAIAAAQAAVQTKEDRYMLGQLQLKAALAAKDDAQIIAASDVILNSGMATPEQVRVFRINKAKTRYQAKDYAGAQTELQSLLAADPNNTDAMLLSAESYESAGNSQQAIATFEKAIATKQAAGQPVPPEWRKRAVSIAYTHKLPNLSAVTLDWIKASPTPENIRDASRIIGDSTGLSDADQIDLFRLQHRAGALKGESDYYRYANTALTKGFPGEAKTVLDQGFASNAINKSRPVFTSVYTSASSKVAADKATLGTTEKNGLAAATARQALVAGDVFLGYGDYAKAAGLYRAALTKSGADANIINLRLGEALAGSGDKAGAIAAFAKVTGPQQATAQLWSAWVASR
ncbi:tetratricopeptide repeat protein [Sphingomonas sp. KRR8]|uniref:tetratricopeptide repeat protein n=1 Tax=Sphingomonas sp. KRR8 TaxID=2942996 RepID=UPI0020229674|nr:tetratricopeptide repeat protein [Sphingomonas sp. KRR8]URD61597.1 tetratricopeptide repeat protein [Sphingomonas sp. KRR8]